jgi:phosphoribosylanthranilate isomerase
MDQEGKTKIKICGITNREDALMVVSLGADAIGFVFAKSKRKIAPEKAKEIIKILPPFITTVGVFMNTELNKVNKITEYALLDAIQLHGNESPEYCNKVNRKVVKRIEVTQNDTKESLLTKMEPYSVSAYILDPGTGSGETFNWDIAAEIEKPIIIAGGLSPENIKYVVKKLHPYGIDVSSGVEKTYGKKDREKVKKFIEEVRAC